MITPRPYQTEALDAVLGRWRDGVTRQLVSLPTGCGKTLIFGMVAGALKTRTLVLAHREELLLQARQKIRLVYPEADVGILKAEERSGLWADICVASVQTAMRNTEALRERGFRLLICDEAHHAAAASYTKIFEALGFMEGDRSKLLLGVTATAYRGDNVGLGSVFEEIVFERSILAMMKAGYLCDVRGWRSKPGPISPAYIPVPGTSPSTSSPWSSTPRSGTPSWRTLISGMVRDAGAWFSASGSSTH